MQKGDVMRERNFISDSRHTIAMIFNLMQVWKSVATLLMSIFISLNLFSQTISSFSPITGPVGTSVTINGTGFNITPANNIVFFGATMGTVTAASATSLSVTVNAGANYQYITVTNLGTNLAAYSAIPFNVTTACSDAATFAAALSAQGGSHNIEIYDMDGDGKPDMIIADYFNNYFTVTRNTSTVGSISFASKLSFAWAAGGQPNEVSIGDFDGDGKPDVALGGNGGGTFVSVYRNTSTVGSISFAARQDFTASSGQGNGNKIIDIDGDGKPDLVSVHWSGNCVWVLRNTSTVGSISFAAGVSFTTTTQPHKIDLGDLDGDGKPDVVITAFTSNKLSIFRNTSTAGTISFAARQDFSPGTVPYFVHLADLDGDNLLDIAVVNRDVATLAVYRNTSTVGSITLATRQDFATPAGTFTHYGVAIGDLDGDNKPDVVACNYTLNVTSIFRNTSSVGAISFATRVDIASGVSYDAGIADFDGDERPDIAVTNSGTTVSILTNICTLLPIELISFTAERFENEVILKWVTETENNNDYFTLERSNNGNDFISIGEINGAGNSTSILKYVFTDDAPNAGMNYYRLKQTDFDGNTSYSQIALVDFEAAAGTINIYNDLINNKIIINGTKENGNILIFDLTGKIILSQKSSEGITIVDIISLNKGFYLLNYSFGNINENKLIVK